MNDYLKHRKFIKTGDLCELRSETLLGDLICLKTGLDVNHSAAFVWLGSEAPHYPPRLFLVEAIWDGVVISLFSRRLEELKGAAYWYPLIATDEQRNTIEYYLLTKAGTRCGYDYESLCNLLVGKVPVDEKRMFCSELYQSALMQAGFKIDNQTAFVPGEFEHLPFIDQRVCLKGNTIDKLEERYP